MLSHSVQINMLVMIKMLLNKPLPTVTSILFSVTLTKNGILLTSNVVIPAVLLVALDHWSGNAISKWIQFQVVETTLQLSNVVKWIKFKISPIMEEDTNATMEQLIHSPKPSQLPPGMMK